MFEGWVWLWLMWDWAKSAFAFLGIAGFSISALVGGSYLLFKTLGEKWLNQKFAEQLETYKAEQARELERLRHRINGVFDRTRRLHDREFEVLPDLWSKLVEARNWSAGYLSAFQQYADVGRMSDVELDEFLAKSRFSEGHQREIKKSTKRQELYCDVVNLHRYADIMDKLSDVSADLSKHGIFVLPPLRDDMKKMVEIVHFAVTEHQINDEHKVRPRMKEASDRLNGEGEALFKRIEEAVTARLWDSTTADV